MSIIRSEADAGRLVLLGSLAVRREILRTGNSDQLARLVKDQAGIMPIAKDEKVLGFHTQHDPFGGSTINPLVSDFQDERLKNALIALGVKPDDAGHLAQASANCCDYFLTRDWDTIINRYRRDIERICPPMKVRAPSELVAELGLNKEPRIP